MSAAEIATYVGATMAIGAPTALYLILWVTAIRDRDAEGVLVMLIITFIIGALLFLIGATW